MNRDFEFINKDFSKDLKELINKHNLDKQFDTNCLTIENYILDSLVMLFMFINDNDDKISCFDTCKHFGTSMCAYPERCKEYERKE